MFHASGTLLDDRSDEFIRCFRNADLIIAKGQGNYEALSDNRR
ncbi:MAG: ARMT1-like domain-containing protein, partial [Candidatus Wallbacteria bacterium]|nr:ARMT1-like domain-containing protein [Candidatus Wallbacteria bacterium]